MTHVRRRHQRLKGGGFGPGGPSIQDIFGDLFGEFFGGQGGRRRGGAERGADLRYNMELTFEQAAFGHETEITVPRLGTCETCSGSGAKAGTRPRPCNQCGGMGEVRVTQGFFAISRTCPGCQSLQQYFTVNGLRTSPTRRLLDSVIAGDHQQLSRRRM